MRRCSTFIIFCFQERSHKSGALDYPPSEVPIRSSGMRLRLCKKQICALGIEGTSGARPGPGHEGGGFDDHVSRLLSAAESRLWCRLRSSRGTKGSFEGESGEEKIGEGDKESVGSNGFMVM